MILNIIGFIFLLALMFVFAFIFNGLMYFVADKLGWFTEPLKKTRWYDKYFDRMNVWYLEKLEEQKKDGI